VNLAVRPGAAPADPERRERYPLVISDVVTVAAAATVAGAGWRTTLCWALPLVLMFAAAGLYRPRLRYSALDQVPRVLAAIGLAAVVLAGLPLPVTLTPRALAGRPVLWLLVLAVGLLANRALTYRWLYRRRSRGAGRPTLVVGAGDVGIRLAEILCADRSVGLAPLGLVGPPPVVHRDLPVPVLGPVTQIDTIIQRYRPRALAVAFAGHPDADLVGTLRRCRRDGITVYVVPRLFELPVGDAGAELVEGLPLVRLHPDPASPWRARLKRAMDIAGALIALALLSPVLAICALAVRWESGRAGVLFRQQRIGRSGKPFTIMKFRSLTPASTVESEKRWTIAHDDRVGPVGRVLRATSLDELPQLVNVLRGDMSLVGPRPERPYFVEQFARTHSGYADRHRVPAGITGWAQIHGLRGDTSIEDRVRFDNYYVENWSLGLDLKIILRTVTSMFSFRRR
jgi:exopolysaccharide biosynthesis polyprenyl glycosylphosphotransferase